MACGLSFHSMFRRTDVHHTGTSCTSPSLSVSPLSLSLDLFLVCSSGPAIDYEISEINDLIYV